MQPVNHLPKAIVPKVMATYRELLAQVKGEIDEISSIEAHERLESSDGSIFVDVRESGRVGRGAHPRRDLHRPRPPRAADRGPRPRQGASARRLLLGGEPLGVCREGARGARLRKRREPRGRLLRLEAERLRGHHPAGPLSRAALALQPAPAHPRGRRGRTAAPARRARPADRRRRARLAGVALPRRRRSRDARDRRRRRRRRVQPPAPDRPLDRPARRAEGRVREAHARGSESRRSRRALTRSA